MTRRQLWAVVALTLLGGTLRFATLDRQSFWLDELVTVSLLQLELSEVLAEIPRTEATPYVYYVVAWAWGSLLGLGEVGLRSLSALAGTTTIPVAYAAGAVLVSRRAGLAAAALVATNPFLVWYSQEARSYALLALLTAGSVLAFAFALRGERRGLAAWAAVSALAIATHYFALFVVAAEAAWLLARVRPSRRVGLAALVPGIVLLAQAPLLLAQRDNAEAVTGSSLAARVAGIPKNLTVGYSFPLEALGSVVAALLLLVGLALVARASPGERHGAIVAGSLAALAVVAPVALSLVGVDFLVARNTIAAVVPAAVCLGAGYATGRLGAVAAGALCSLSAAIALVPAFDTSYGRTDWRGAAARLAHADVPRAIVVTPFMSRTLWRPYLPGLSEPASDSVRVREIAVVGLATEGGYSAGRVEPPDADPPPAAPAGFHLVAAEREPTYTLAIYRADTLTVVPTSALGSLALAPEQPGLLLQP